MDLSDHFVLGLFVLAVGNEQVFELFFGVKELGHDKVQQGPKLLQVVLERCPSEE